MKKPSKKDLKRISLMRDTITNVYSANRFKLLLSEDRMDDAMSLADEFFEWLHPTLKMREDTLYSDYDELRQQYNELTS
tara:strand:+ start:559 stop:795 length:237 start_codon:yes stop_codon:yes gene_type:complete